MARAAHMHDEHASGSVPRDPDLPTVSNVSLAFLAGGALVVVTVAMVAFLA